MPRKRKYTCVITGENFGTYKSYYPSLSAKRIFTTLSRKLNCDIMQFQIRELNNDEKIFTYRGVRTVVVNPEMKLISGKIFISKFKYRVYRVYD